MERKEELRFNSYWEENLKELTVKHIWDTLKNNLIKDDLLPWDCSFGHFSFVKGVVATFVV